MKVLFFFLVTLFLTAGAAFAQNALHSESNTVTTRVGNPVGGVAACPIPSGQITCGSKNVPVNGCGHCGLGYDAYMSNCSYPGIYYAMDIGGSDFQDVILPSVNGKIITWVFLAETNNVGNQAIQNYSGTDSSTGEKYRLQFHHTAPGSGGGTHSSSEVGAKICGNGCGMGHVHVEFGKITPSGTDWVDAPNYFCK